MPPSLEAAGSADSDILFLSWREKSSDPRSIYYPSSSWTQGRNRLLKEVLGRPYHYLIFGDGDVQLELTPMGRATRPREESPWRLFERFLLAREPAIGCPAYDWHLIGHPPGVSEACSTLRFFDAVLNAFHHEALPVLLPYYDLLDEASECYSQSLLCSLAADLYAGHVLQTNWVRMINPQALRGDPEFLLSKPEHLYLESLRSPIRIRGFLRQTYGSAARHPSMGPALAKRESYARSSEDLARDHRLDHPLWVRKREWMALPADAAFFSSDPDSARARRWRSQRNRGAPPPPPPLMLQRLRAGARPIRQWYRRFRASLFEMGRESARRAAQDQALGRWRQWVRQPGLYFEIPECEQVKALALLAAALDRLGVDRVVYIDVGAGRGDVLDLFQRKSGLRKPVLSIGIDPIDVRAHRSYSGFVLGAIASAPEGTAEFFRYSSSDCSSLKRMNPASVSHDPSDAGKGKYFTTEIVEQLEETLRVPTFRLDTVLRQYGLDNEVLHFVKIDAQGSDLDVFLSLGDLTQNCLFLRIETVLPEEGAPAHLLYEGQTTFTTDRVAIEAAGFRLLNISRFGVTPEADVTFVNLRLFRELLPDLAT